MSDSLDFALSPEHSPARSPLASPPHDDVPLSEPLTESETHFETPQEVEAPSTPVPPSRSTSYSLPPTRTVAIIKAHAMDHRFDIEQRISEAGFEVRCIPCVPSVTSVIADVRFHGVSCSVDRQGETDGV